MSNDRTRRRWALGTIVTLALVPAAALIYFFLTFAYLPQAPRQTAGPNAVWLSHRWVGAVQPPAEYDALAERLRQHRISDAFFHVGPLQADGTIPSNRHPAAIHMLRALHRRLPMLRAQAWIGQVEKAGGGPLDLSQPVVRANIAETATAFLDLGFDGIHLNVEPSSGNPHLLALLSELRDRTATHAAVLSMASDELEPLPGLAWLTRAAGTQAGFWTADYYRAVAGRVDQLAVMMYDTALPTDWLYGALVRWQTNAVREAAGPGKTVFVGVPTYEEDRLTFHPEAENVTSALRGIRQGLHDAPPEDPAAFGVAIYADWTTDASEWRHIRDSWLAQSEQRAAK
jgi:hypothetical protein